MTAGTRSELPATRFGVAILTWRGYEQTARCVRSLRRTPEWPFPLVVVDNASGTGEGERIATEFGPPVVALTLPSNDGVSAGYNAALTWASRAGLDHLLLLNNDTVVDGPEFFSRLLAATGPDVAAVMPLVRDERGGVLFAGGRLLPWLGHVRRLRRPGTAPHATEWIEGSCALVSIAAACAVGGLAPDYFLYWEDVDWSVRARREGYQLLVEPGTHVTHTETSSASSRQKRFYSLRNSLLFVRRSGTPAQNLTATAFWLAVRLPLFLARRIPEDGHGAVQDAWRALTWNVRDARRRRGWTRRFDGPDVCTVRT